MAYTFEKQFERLKAQEFDAFREASETRALTDGQHKRANVSQGPYPKQITKHIFICGLHRSGTTLIHDSLYSQFDLSYLKAPVPESEGQHLQDVIPSDSAYLGVGKFAFSAEMQTKTPSSNAETEATRRKIASQWAPWIVGNFSTLIEKSPPNLIRIPFLRAVFPGAQFLIWTRNPKAVSIASKRWCNSSDTELLLHWNVAHSIALQSLESDCILARYEDFCEDPNGEMARIAAFLNLKKRDNPLKMRESFKTLSNTNQKYFRAFSAPEFKQRQIWRYFGY